jgi:peptidoglycan hydrolase CwlO-like protein
MSAYVRVVTGITWLQVGSLEEDIEVHKGDIDKLKIEVKKRDGIINSLKTDIEGLRKEIEERDETIQDKVGGTSNCGDVIIVSLS